MSNNSTRPPKDPSDETASDPHEEARETARLGEKLSEQAAEQERRSAEQEKRAGEQDRRAAEQDRRAEELKEIAAAEKEIAEGQAELAAAFARRAAGAGGAGEAEDRREAGSGPAPRDEPEAERRSREEGSARRGGPSADAKAPTSRAEASSDEAAARAADGDEPAEEAELQAEAREAQGRRGGARGRRPEAGDASGEEARARVDRGGGEDKPNKMRTRKLNVWYGETQAIKNADLDIRANEIIALMGPSGCGKSTFLRCLNRMNDPIDTARVDGQVFLDDDDIYDSAFDPVLARLRVGMVAQAPNPFPKSIYDNVAFGPRLHGLVDNKKQLDQVVENTLKRAGLWEEVKDILDQPGTALSGGQQQRLCIARAIANEPDVILMDEPCSSLDPVSTETIEQLMRELIEQFTVVIVTHNMEQAERVSQRVAYFHLGELVEVGPTETIINDPDDERTRRYVSGYIG